MAENTKIEWCDFTFNCWRGCTKISSGCRFCYAETLSGRNPATLGVWGPNGTRVVAAESQWKLPLKWNKAAACTCNAPLGKSSMRSFETCPQHAGPHCRPRVFCASLADVFEDWRGPMVDAKGNVLDSPRSRPMTASSSSSYDPLSMQDVRARLFALIDATPNLDWLVLSKRPENIERMMPIFGDEFRMTDETGILHQPRPNLWLGTSVEDQKELARIDTLRTIPAAVRFLSIEPLLEDLGTIDLSGIHWVIVGGESGPNSRPFQLDWARAIQNQCDVANVPLFFKQAGSNPHDWTRGDPDNYEPSQIVQLRLRNRKGGDLSELPHCLNVRDFPEANS